MNKNIVILGGTSGVGKAIALSLIPYDTDITIVGRNEDKAKEIKIISNNKINYILGDLTKKNEQKRIVDILNNKLSKIDVLLDTFGVYPTSPTINIRSNLQSHYEIITLLTPLLSKSQQSRVFIVTGNPVAINNIPIPSTQNNVVEMASWEISYKTLLMIYLSDQLIDYNIMVNSFYPGEVRSNLMPWTRNLKNTNVPVGKYLSLSNKLVNKTGEMFDQNGSEIYLPKEYYYKENQNKLKKYLN
ncbi:hypothetical protein BG261_02265 [Floricoccus tropicus]|uniref:Short-chain dehydrogenase n=1 Tax=Floricoccus tropicus TaxID=1859473 RepID=A0A1E8GP86_9LACT|nr:SDR family NAD(P)-dependent oxidoreductase [Floricoccus tropicus]OFI49423.1 hypothetical protein BG261_02265 [Floricoccus tropicus]